MAADVAQRVLPIFEAESTEDRRPREAIARAREFSRGELNVSAEIRQIFVAFHAADGVTSPAATAAARAAAHAAAVPHMAAHALAAAAYAAKAVELSPGHDGLKPDSEVSWQINRMTDPVRAALCKLPRLGEDAAGPLGKGLLTSGTLAETIREIHDDLARQPGIRP